MLYSLTRSLKCRQVGQVQMNISVNGTAATPVASGPDAAFIQSIVDGGAGLYTINLKEAAKIAPFVSGLVSLTDQAIGRVSAVTTSSITIQFDDPATGNAKDADFNIQFQFSEQLSYYF
jgi:hypothetical protein